MYGVVERDCKCNYEIHACTYFGLEFPAVTLWLYHYSILCGYDVYQQDYPKVLHSKVD